jgi:hypothetical protein
MTGANNINSKFFCDRRFYERGSSLIGLCLLIVSLGAILTGGLALYKNYELVTSDQETVDKNLMITKAINDFVFRNDRYPCAAPLNAPMDSPNYGREHVNGAGVTVACNSPNYYNAFRAPNPANPITNANLGGIYITAGDIRPGTPFVPANPPTQPNPIPARPPVPTGNIIIGALPTRDLNLPDDLMYDGYGRRFIYAVTANMATAGIDTTQDLGGITIQDEAGRSLSEMAGHVIYSYFSPAIDSRGAFSKDGALIEDCNPGAQAGDNCDNDSIFLAALRKRY